MDYRPKSIPVIDGRETLLVFEEEDHEGDCRIVFAAPDGARETIGLVDGKTGFAYPVEETSDDPRLRDAKPLVIVTGDLDGPTGQVKILEDDGIYRRYSRWDKVDSNDFPDHPGAFLQSLPQCGCGGYLGAPTVFPSFAEMVAYFFVVFTMR